MDGGKDGSETFSGDTKLHSNPGSDGSACSEEGEVMLVDEEDSDVDETMNACSSSGSLEGPEPTDVPKDLRDSWETDSDASAQEVLSPSSESEFEVVELLKIATPLMSPTIDSLSDSSEREDDPPVIWHSGRLKHRRSREAGHERVGQEVVENSDASRVDAPNTSTELSEWA